MGWWWRKPLQYTKIEVEEDSFGLFFPVLARIQCFCVAERYGLSLNIHLLLMRSHLCGSLTFSLCRARQKMFVDLVVWIYLCFCYQLLPTQKIYQQVGEVWWTFPLKEVTWPLHLMKEHHLFFIDTRHPVWELMKKDNDHVCARIRVY